MQTEATPRSGNIDRTLRPAGQCRGRVILVGAGEKRGLELERAAVNPRWSCRFVSRENEISSRFAHHGDGGAEVQMTPRTLRNPTLLGKGLGVRGLGAVERFATSHLFPILFHSSKSP